MVSATRTPKKTRRIMVGLSHEGRQLLEEVMEEGTHGTLFNTIEVALKTHRRFLRGELVVNRNPAELAHAGS